MSIYRMIQIGLAVLLLIGFVLPWVTSADVSFSGIGIGGLSAAPDTFPEGFETRLIGVGAVFFDFFYLVPVLALLTIAAAVVDRGLTVVASTTGLVTIVLFLFWIGDFQTDLRGMMGIGLWIVIVSAILMVIAALSFRLDPFLHFVDELSAWTGKTFAWTIIILTFGVSYEVFVRYALRAPTSWAYDISYMMYGSLFLMAGAYTLANNGHVRADVVYRLWPVKVQATVDLILFVLFYFPGVMALIYSGFIFARMSFMFKEASVFSPAGIPIYQLKALIPVAGIFLFLQGISELVRCSRAIRTGVWPTRLQDVDEMGSALQHFQEDQERLESERQRPRREEAGR
jgi:TRAP-type mannitol/chloroaromatic compound transport system permease small subunit